MSDPKTAPDFVDLNDTDVDAMSQTGQYADGTYQLVVGKCKSTVNSKNSNLLLVMPLRAVDRTGKATGPEVTKFITVPVPNPQVPGHVPEFRIDDKGTNRDLREAREVIRALLGPNALPRYPQKKGEGKNAQYVHPETGEPMTFEQRKQYIKSIDNATARILLGWYNRVDKSNPESPRGHEELTNGTMLGVIKRDTKGKAWLNYVRGVDDPPKDKTGNTVEIKYDHFFG